MRYVAIICAGIILAGCQAKKLNADELQQWLRQPANGCSQAKTIGPWEITATYRPGNLVAWQAWEAESKLGALSEDYRDSLKKDFAQYHYFNVQISADGKEAEAYEATPAVFSERVQTFSFRMKPLVQLIYDRQDTVEAAHYSYDRTFGMGQATNFLFVFNNKQPNAKEVQLYIQDPGLGYGSQKFSFELSALRKSNDQFLY